MTRQVVVVENEKFDARIAEEVLGGVAEVTITDARTADELVDAAAGADALIPWYVNMSGEVLDALDSLEVLGIAGIGVDGVDLEAAKENGITVVNASTYAVDEVSTHAMAMLLSAVRSLPAFDEAVRAGEWGRHPGAPIHRIRGRTLGLVSFGDIARATARKARGFDMEVVAHDPYVDADVMAEHRVEKVDFEDLLSRADHLSAHAPLTPETEGLLDREAFATFEGGVVVNTGRGPVIDEAGLIAALDAGHVEAAALDVFETEPPTGSPLLDRDDVLLSPHVAWYSEESRDDSVRNVAEDIRTVFEGGTPEGLIDPDADWH